MSGNMTFDNSKAFTYTADRLLASVGGTSTMLWDAAKNRIGFTASDGGAYTFVYDPTAGIPAVIEEWTPSGTVQYVRAPGGALIARVAGTETQYYHFSDLGSTLFLTNSNALATDKYSYNAWGKPFSHDGPTEQPYQYVGQYGYYAHYQDANMGGLLQLGVRFYDPEIGRFSQVDPISEGFNWYSYVNDNPFVYIDPSGMSSAFVGALPFAGGAAVADGPLPIGDAVGIGILLGAAVLDGIVLIDRVFIKMMRNRRRKLETEQFLGHASLDLNALIGNMIVLVKQKKH